MLGYKCLYSRSPRSFLFSVVANVGPHSASRPLAVAYRQGNDVDTSLSSMARVEHVVADTLALIEILSGPANRAPLEAERALAEDWYCRSQGATRPRIVSGPAFQIHRSPLLSCLMAPSDRRSHKYCLSCRGIVTRSASSPLQRRAFC
jgi:hypothetical protein